MNFVSYTTFDCSSLITRDPELITNENILKLKDSKNPVATAKIISLELMQNFIKSSILAQSILRVKTLWHGTLKNPVDIIEESKNELKKEFFN